MGYEEIEEINSFIKRFDEEETEKDKRYLCQEMARAIRRCEETLEEKFKELFDKHNLEELYLIQEVLEKEIRLSKTAIAEGFE